MQWSPRPAQTVALAVCALLLTGAVFFLDAAGRLLVGTAALGTWAGVLRDVVARPRLAARPDGVDVRSWFARTHLPWPLLRVRVRETRRLGIAARALELDTAGGPDDAGVLVVLSRRDLGADPRDVAEALRRLHPAPR